MKFPTTKIFKASNMKAANPSYLNNLLVDCQKEGLTINYVDEKKDSLQVILNSEEEKQTLELILLYHLVTHLKRIDEKNKENN